MNTRAIRTPVPLPLRSGTVPSLLASMSGKCTAGSLASRSPGYRRPAGGSCSAVRRGGAAREGQASASYGLRVKVKLPERQKPGSYREPDYPYKYIPEKY